MKRYKVKITYFLFQEFTYTILAPKGITTAEEAGEVALKYFKENKLNKLVSHIKDVKVASVEEV